MKCIECESNMLIRNGRFGEFYYCPNQHICGGKTVTKNPPERSNGFYELCLSGLGGGDFYSTSIGELKALAHRDNIAWCVDELDDDPLY